MATTTSNSEDNAEDLFWGERIRRTVAEKELNGVTCNVYSTRQAKNNSIPSDLRCVCGRRARKHSFDGEPQTDPPSSDADWDRIGYGGKTPVTVYGVWQNKMKFVRWDHARIGPSVQTTTADKHKERSTLPTIAKILCADAHDNKPTLLISCYGGAKYFKMNDKLETKFMDGIGQAAATKGVWLLSTGLNSGVSKVIGQSVWRANLLSEEPTVIGLSSWGCLSEKTREAFRKQATLDQARKAVRRKSIAKMDAPFQLMRIGGSATNGSPPSLDENEFDTVESNHTHLLLLDDGSEGSRKKNKETGPFYITDDPRSRLVDELVSLTKCYAVTIIIEGGLDSIEVIRNDLLAKRPVVIIHGSGRLADVLGDLLDLVRGEISIGKDEIKQQLEKVDTQKELEKYVKDMEFILGSKNRSYLNIFKRDDNTSLTDTIFLSFYQAEKHRREDKNVENNSGLGNDLRRLLDISVEWNCSSAVNYIARNREKITDEQSLNRDLFEKALKGNRPVFVDYFLRRQYNILETKVYNMFKTSNKEQKLQILSSSPTNNTQTALNETTCEVDDARICAMFALKFIVEKLYENPIDHLKESGTIHAVTDLDNLYYPLIGPYSKSFYRERKTKNRFQLDVLDKWRSFLSLFNRCMKKSEKSSSLSKPSSGKIHPIKKNTTEGVGMVVEMNLDQECYSFNKTYGNEEMLRDIFLWSVISGHAEMSFVLLLQVKCRIVASLIAAGITGRFLKTKGGYLDQWHHFKKQSKDYEDFATSCIDACYEKSERRACQLLLREIPSFGDITCMQVAISFRLRSFINTRCFNQVLNRQWYGALDQSTNQSIWSTICFLLSIMTLGVLAPLLLDYRNDYINVDKREEFNLLNDNENSISKHGKRMKDQDSINMTYWQQVLQFHRTPIVRMVYDFLFYIWMLLAFSYMMLFHMKPEDTSTHWTEIYVIVTISAMLIEDIRKIFIEYCTQMLERWHQSDLWIVPLYTLPYILFYIGIGIQFGSRAGRPDLFTTARIILALDLELWFLFSLRFVSAVKLLGPKLFMIRNMVRDLAGFIYIIFICIAAYGIVSRSLTMYENIEFTARNLSASIFYPTYWLLYSIADDEKNYYDGIIGSPTSSADQVAAATTTQVLLAFHMLFINILILNLLIAVFNFSINAVQEESEYLWRYQRYELIREYFEKPPLAYPPLSVLGYLWPLYKWIRHGKDILRILKRFTTQKRNKDWTDFEGAATFAYARHFVDRMYRDSSTLVIPTFSETDELKLEIESLKRQNNELYKIIDRLDIHSKKTTPAMNWIMGAMKRVKMSKEEPPLFRTSTSDS